MSDGFVMKALETGSVRPAVSAAPAIEILFHVNPDDVIVLATE